MAEIRAEPQIDFSALFEQDLDGCVIIDSKQAVLRVNRSFTRMFGYSEAEAIGAIVDDLILPADRRAEAQTFANRVRQTGELSLETVRQRKDGTRVHVWVLAFPHVTLDGQRVVYVQYRDITAQKRAEESLRSREAQLRAIFEQVPIGIIHADLQGRITVCNEAFSELLGYTAGEALGLTPDRFVHPEDMPAMHDARAKLQQGLVRTVEAERRYLRKDGEYIWVKINYSLIRDSAGQPLHFIGTIEDITLAREARKNREAALELFKSLIAQMRDGIVVVGLDWKIAAINQAFIDKLFPGGSVEAALGTDFRPMIDQVAALAEEPGEFRRVLAQRTSEAIPACDTVCLRDGRVFERDYVPIRGHGGQLNGHLIDCHDLTPTIKLQEQLRQSQKMEAVGRLAGGIAHDFNNLLTVLQGHAAMLLEDSALPDALRDDVAEIMKASNKAANLTRQLLAYSRQQVLKPVVLNPGDVVQDLERTLLRIIREDIRLHVRIQPDTPLVRADRTQIEQVILNLAVNARDAMPKGGEITILTKRCVFERERIERDFTLPPGTYALLCVSDSGEGIPERVLPRIFDPFFTTKETGKGTGLGLATVYGIVKQSGGYILCTSTPGAGAKFEIFLPEAQEMR